jgi:hypothetical protein
LNLRSSKEETVIETVALTLDYLGTGLNMIIISMSSDFPDNKSYVKTVTLYMLYYLLLFICLPSCIFRHLLTFASYISFFLRWLMNTKLVMWLAMGFSRSSVLALFTEFHEKGGTNINRLD